MGERVSEKHYKPGSTVVINCQIINFREDFQQPVWTRNGVVITGDKDRTKGGTR